MSAAYAFFVSVFVYKDLTLKQVPKVLLDSANLSAMILYIITNAVLFSFLLTSEQIPQALSEWINTMGLSPWMFLVVVNILLLIAGNFMEPSSILLITAPILFPVAMKLGIDPIHLGIIMTVNMEIGMITPPVGLNLYVASGHLGHGIDRDHQGLRAMDPGDDRLPASDHLRSGDHQPVAAEPADGRQLMLR